MITLCAKRSECWDGKTHMQCVYHDGGRLAAGFKGHTDDCVTRAIAIALELDYREVYDALNLMAKKTRHIHKSSSRTGVNRRIYQKFLAARGWQWKPCVTIGSGCTVSLCEEDLPLGRVICRVSKHMTCIVDHVVYDTHDPQRDCIVTDGAGAQRISRRCVYGYFTKN